MTSERSVVSVRSRRRLPKIVNNDDNISNEGSDSQITDFKLFKTYLKDIFQESLITSLPEIATNKSTTKRLIKIIVLLLCCAGFVIQTLDFLEIYYTYATDVNKLVSHPYEIVQPAFSVCNRNRMRRTAFCGQHPESCTWLKPDMYCLLYPRNCPDDRTKVFTGGQLLYAYMDLSVQWEYAFLYGHTSKIIDDCSKIIEGRQENCSKQYRQVPFLTAEGEPNLCYTVDSLWDLPDAEPDIYSTTFTWTLVFDLEPEEYTSPHEPVYVHIAVHDRRALINPFLEGNILEGGVEYNAYVSLEEEELMPPPYDTNCIDYLSLWKKRNGTGPINKMMCVEECKLNTLLERGLCIDRNVAYPHTEPMCKSKEDFTLTSDIIELCTKQCNRACRDGVYTMRIEVVGNYSGHCKTVWCKNSKAKINLLFNRFQLTQLIYHPKFESVEVFSYIGGYMGMWIGLSLVSSFDLLETVCKLLYFPMKKCRWLARKNDLEKRKKMRETLSDLTDRRNTPRF